MGKATPILTRHELHEVALDLDRIALPREPETLRETGDVRVHDDSLRLTELGSNDVRGFAGNPRKPEEVVEPPWDASIELLDEHLHRTAQPACLLTVEPG